MDGPAQPGDQPWGYGPAWARHTTCCGKPVGCTNMSAQCLMRNHPWKQRNVQPPAADDSDGET